VVLRIGVMGTSRKIYRPVNILRFGGYGK